MRLTTAARKKIPSYQYGLPAQAPGPGSYPMPDKQHAVLAKSYASRFATPTQQAIIKTKANAILAKYGAKR